jgi:hypothetical protein
MEPIKGLFYKKYQSNEAFKLISGTKGQVWSLFEYDGTLFCGHDSGTFIIGDGTAKKYISFSGTWKFEKVPYKKRCCFKVLYYFSIGKKSIMNGF